MPVDIAILALNDYTSILLEEQKHNAYWYRFLGWLIFVTSEKIETKKAPKSPSEFLPFDFDPRDTRKPISRPSAEEMENILKRIDNARK